MIRMLPVCLVGALALTGCAGRMPLVGFNQHGKPIEAYVNEHKYAERLTEALVTIEESVVPALRESQQESAWKLRTAVVGFGVKAEAGIGPFKLAIKPRIRAAFANGEKPPIP